VKNRHYTRHPTASLPEGSVPWQVNECKRLITTVTVSSSSVGAYRLDIYLEMDRVGLIEGLCG